MKKTFCYIINYNAKDYLLSCLQSVLEAIADLDNVEVCVIDNASTDDSVQVVRRIYGDTVRIVVNDINTGGAGGFNTALTDALKRDVEYAILLDNDIRLDKDCISNLLSYLEEHEDVGAVGAKVMMMDEPDYIQEFGSHLDMERYFFKADYWHERDNGTPDTIESEWLTACTLAVRMEAAKKTNLFPAENFIFWDDFQFTWEIHEAGYKLISLASAKVWHKGRKKVVDNTVPAYYGLRNRLKFYSLCINEDELEIFCRGMLEETFNILFGSRLKGLDIVNSCRMLAMDDFIHKRYGKIRDEIVWHFDGNQDLIAEVCEGHHNVYIKDEVDTSLVADELTSRLNNIPEIKIVAEESEADIIFVTCNHVNEQMVNILPKIYVDRYLNVIRSEDDIEIIKAVPYMKQMFVDLHYDWLMQGIIEERKRYYGSE